IRVGYTEIGATGTECGGISVHIDIVHIEIVIGRISRVGVVWASPRDPYVLTMTIPKPSSTYFVPIAIRLPINYIVPNQGNIPLELVLIADPEIIFYL